MKEQNTKLEVRKKHTSIMALFAALAFLIYALPSVIQYITVYFLVKGLLLGTIPAVLVAVSLFRMKKDLMVTIAFGIRMLAAAYWLSVNHSVDNLLSVIATAVTFAIVFVTCSLPPHTKINVFFKKLWFLPLVFVAIDNILYISQIYHVLLLNIGILISMIAEIIAIAFVGLWIKKD